MDAREEVWADAMRTGRGGDAAVYERLLREISDLLRRIVRRRLAQLGLGTADTEDVVQEVLIGLHSRRHSWDETRPFLPWLHAIVRYKLTDAARRLGRDARRRFDLDAAGWENLFAEPSVDIDRGTVDVDRHLGTLPPHQRDVVLAVAVEGASVQATAHRFRTSEGTIRMTLHRALIRIASKTGAEPVAPAKGRDR